MFYKTILVASLLSTGPVFSSLEPTLEAVEEKYEFLQAVINKTDPAVVVHAFYGDANSEDWSGEVSKLCIPVYSVNLRRKNNLIRNDTFIKDTSITLSDNSLYLVPIKDLTSFKQVVEDVRQLVFWRAKHRVVVITNASTETVTEFFRYCFKHWIINIELVLNHDLTRTYTYNPFEGLYLIQGDISSMFPDKIRNLHRFQLNISMFHECPDACKDKDDYKGFDGWVSKTITDTVNATYRYLSPAEGDFFGDYNESSIDGVLGHVVRHEVHVGFNARMFRDRWLRVVDPTFPHARNDLVVLIPIQETKLKNVLSATSYWAWIFLLILTLILFLYFYKFHKYLGFGAVTGIIILVVTGKSVTELKGACFRTVFLSSMVLVFYIQAEFNCKLTSVLAVSDVSKQPQTLEELWSGPQYKIRSRPSYTKYLTQDASELKLKFLWRFEGLDRDRQVSEITQCKKQVIIAKSNIAHFALASGLVKNKTVCYEIMKEVLMPAPQVYVLAYGSPFKERFDWILGRLRDSGMMDWKRKTQIARSWRGGSDEPLRLSLETLFVAFVVLGMGLVLAAAAFLYEYGLNWSKEE